MFSPSGKKRLLAVLVAGFGIQAALVYGDRRQEPLSESARSGRALYHARACQVCHQIYGQGGFLGPDLTNAASRVDQTRLRSLLTVGSGQMPALGMSAVEIADLTAFLHEIDRPDLGRGQLRMGDAGRGPDSAFASAARERLIAGSPEADGFFALQSRPCSQCHVPFERSAVGAPDLSLVAGRLSSDEIASVLELGRPGSGMPPTGLSADERVAAVAYFDWLHRNRGELRSHAAALAAPRPLRWSALPWWEFP